MRDLEGPLTITIPPHKSRFGITPLQSELVEKGDKFFEAVASMPPGVTGFTWGGKRFLVESKSRSWHPPHENMLPHEAVEVMESLEENSETRFVMHRMIAKVNSNELLPIKTVACRNVGRMFDDQVLAHY